MDLNNKIAIVTGASKGLGKATSIALIQKGCKVYGLARSANKLDQLRDELGNNFQPVVMDVSDENAIKNWIEYTFSETHRPTILINNAGMSQFDDVDKLTSEKWKAMVDVNLNSVHYMTAGIVPLMKADKDISYIINVGSILGKVSGSSKSGYSATKFAIQGYTEALFKELRGFNIKVSVLNPGSIGTNFFQSSGIEPNEKMLQPKELANIIVYLLESPDNVLIDELTVRPLRPN
ncbi:MAG: SDR family oxidoreductase [Brumimicrobium sp.]